jgi:discoidin domain receptor family protein 2
MNSFMNLDGLISYSIPQGDKRGYDVDFFDKIYDGENENGILKGGLGQLTDGILGTDDYRLADNNWIGWKRKSSNTNLVFYFDTIRNFTSIRIHTSNLFTHDVSLFQSLIITNCDNKTNHRIELIIPDDYTNITARFIHVYLADQKSLLSNCLDMKLNFNNRSKWILISEIQFDSTPIIGKSLS